MGRFATALALSLGVLGVAACDGVAAGDWPTPMANDVMSPRDAGSTPPFDAGVIEPTEPGLDAGDSDSGTVAPDASVPVSSDAGVDAGPPPPAPTNLRAFVGGRDVALIWDGVPGATAYQVVRDGQPVAMASPRPAGTRFSGNATWLDATVTLGRRYGYQVQAVVGGRLSALSAQVSVVHQSLGTPVPTITVDASADPALAGYLAKGKAFLESWYPKLGDALAQPEYSPPTAFTLRVVKGPCPFAAITDGTRIDVCADFARSDPDDDSLFAHEATHVLQAYGGAAYRPHMVVEGIADWGGDWATGYAEPPPGPGALFTDGYGTAEYFFKWVAERYAVPDFAKRLNVAAHAGTYSDALFVTLTGKTLGASWTEMTGRAVSTPGRLKGPLGKCADLNFYDTTEGTGLSLLTCHTSGFVIGAQEVVSVRQGAAMELRVAGKCVAADAQRAVVLQACTGAAGQRWRVMGATVVNEASGRCLQPRQGLTADGTPLVVEPCTSASPQQWSAPVPGQ